MKIVSGNKIQVTVIEWPTVLYWNKSRAFHERKKSWIFDIWYYGPNWNTWKYQNLTWNLSSYYENGRWSFELNFKRGPSQSTHGAHIFWWVERAFSKSRSINFSFLSFEWEMFWNCSISLHWKFCLWFSVVSVIHFIESIPNSDLLYWDFSAIPNHRCITFLRCRFRFWFAKILQGNSRSRSNSYDSKSPGWRAL